MPWGCLPGSPCGISNECEAPEGERKMFDYKSTCIDFEKRTETERAETLKKVSATALTGLKSLPFPGEENAPKEEKSPDLAERMTKIETAEAENAAPERENSSVGTGKAEAAGIAENPASAEDAQNAGADPSAESDPLTTFAAFLIGSTAADGGVNEREYLLMYPRLTHVFGAECNLSAVKNSYKRGIAGWKTLKKTVAAMQSLLPRMDDELKTETLLLTLCVLSPRGRISLKDRIYLRSLYKKA